MFLKAILCGQGWDAPCKLEADSWGHTWQGSEKGSAWEPYS